jgi:hypothetical protein
MEVEPLLIAEWSFNRRVVFQSGAPNVFGAYKMLLRSTNHILRLLFGRW